MRAFALRQSNVLFTGITAGDQHADRAIVFLHAGVADARMFQHPVEAFASRAQTLAYNRRGFGDTTVVSTTANSGTTVEPADQTFAHAADLAAILDSLTARQIVLVGCSQGARIALDYTVDHPDHVAALMLLAPAFSGAPQPRLDKPAQRLSDAIDVADEADDADLLNELEVQLWLDGPTSPAGRVKGQIRDLVLDMNGIALRAPEWRNCHEPAPVRHRLQQITCPVAIVQGELDVSAVNERAQLLASLLVNATTASVPGAHLFALEQPALLQQHLDTLLASINW